MVCRIQWVLICCVRTHGSCLPIRAHRWSYRRDVIGRPSAYRSSGEAPTDAYGKPGPHVGPPIGSSIRRAIIDAFTINLHEVGITHRQDYLPNGHPVTVVTGGDIYEMLPQYIAKQMAQTLNGSER